MKKLLNNLSVPLIQGGMGVGISLGGLAGAVAREGGMGVISTANIGFREPDFWQNPYDANERALIKEIKKAREISSGKGLIAVNIMTCTTEFSHMVKASVKNGIDCIISGAGMPLNLPEVSEGKANLAPIVSSLRAAKIMARQWKSHYNKEPDFFVVEGPNAGGHLGFKREELLNGSCMDVFSTVKEIACSFPHIPVFTAGGIFDRSDIKRSEESGAAGVQIATRFIATNECDASQGYKDVIISAKEEDIVITESPVGMPGRAVRTNLIRKIEEGLRFPPKRCVRCIAPCNPKETKYCISRALIAAFNGDKENGLFFCGSNAGRVNKMTTVKALIKELY